MINRCDSAAIVPNTSEDLPDPETPVKTVRARLGMSSETSRRLFSRAPRTSMWSRSAMPGNLAADERGMSTGSAMICGSQRILNRP